MTAALINRSLTNVRTELEFLYDSEVIDKALFDSLMESLPKKYAKDMAPWGIDRIPGTPRNGASAPISEKDDFKTAVADSLTEGMKKTSLRDDFSPPPHPPAVVPVPERAPAPALGYCKASYNYESGENGDLKLAKGDLLAVLEHLSPDWWKGYKKGSGPAQAGVFPSNYVTVISDTEFNSSADPEKRAPAPPAQSSGYEVESKYSQSSAVSPPTYQSGYQQQQQQQPSYGGYAQFPPPSTNYYGQQQQMQPQPQQYQQYQQPQQSAPQGNTGSSGSEHLKKFGGKLGNAAIFGAGATIGSDIVNSIF